MPPATGHEPPIIRSATPQTVPLWRRATAQARPWQDRQRTGTDDADGEEAAGVAQKGQRAPDSIDVPRHRRRPERAGALSADV